MMNSHKLRLLTLTAAMFTTAVTAQAQQWVPTATKAPRLVSTDKPAATPAAVVNAVHLAALQPGSQVQVVVALKVRNKTALDSLAAQVMAGQAHPLSADGFKQTYAPSDAQVKAVSDYLASQGFVNISVSDNKLFVTADGTAGSVKTAFNTELHSYNVDGRTAFANASDVSVPASLGDIVLAVHGLQNIHMYHTLAKRAAQPMASVGHNPTDFPVIYNASSLPSATNATIGIITQGSMTGTINDLNTFATKAGYPKPSVSTVTVGSASSDTSGVDEWNMDTQDALAAAGGTIKQMLLYTATTLSDSNLTSAYNRAVTDNKAKVINVSLGECETDAKNSGIMASNGPDLPDRGVAGPDLLGIVRRLRFVRVRRLDVGAELSGRLAVCHRGRRHAAEHHRHDVEFGNGVGLHVRVQLPAKRQRRRRRWPIADGSGAELADLGRRAGFVDQARRPRHRARRRSVQRRTGDRQRQHRADWRHQPGGPAVHRLLGPRAVDERQRPGLPGHGDVPEGGGQSEHVP